MQKVPTVLQDEAFECGLACLSAIAHSHGIKRTLPQLRLQYDITSEGLTFEQLSTIAREINLYAQGYKVDFDDLSDIDTPAIIPWNRSHYVVLTKVTKKYITVMDPAAGNRSFTLEEAELFYGGFVLEFTKASSDSGKESTIAEVEEKPAQPDQGAFNFGFARFFKSFAEYSGYLLPIAALSIVIQLAGVAAPKFISLTLDEVLGKNDEELLSLLIYIFCAVFFIQTCAGFIVNLLNQKLRQFISQEQGNKVVDHLLRMPLKFFIRRTPSDILRRVRATDQAHVIFTAGYLKIAIDIFFAAVFAGLLLNTSMKLASIIISSSVLFLIIRLLLLPALKSRMFASIDREITRDHVLLETINEIESVKIYSQSETRKAAWNNEHIQLEKHRAIIERIQANIELIGDSMTKFQNLVIVGLGAAMVMSGDITVGLLIAFIFYKDFLMENVVSVIEHFTQLKMNQVETDRLRCIEVRESKPLSNYRSSLRTSQEPIEKINLDSVGFGFTNLDLPVFDDINLEINASNKIAIMGQSGSGKSTLVKIISGLLTPTEGKVSINDKQMDRFGHEQFLKQIAFVSPNDKLVQGSVLDNIIYGDHEIDVDAIESSLVESGFDAVVPSLYAGLNTELGAGGADLSSGQKQRLMLARALYRKPKLLFLDEPTSHLDEENRNTLVETIKGLKMGVIIIEHSKSIITACDRVYYMKNGKIAEA